MRVLSKFPEGAGAGTKDELKLLGEVGMGKEALVPEHRAMEEAWEMGRQRTRALPRAQLPGPQAVPQAPRCSPPEALP